METETNHNFAMLTQISEMNKNLAVNTNETANMKALVEEIKKTTKDIDNKVGIQNGRVTKLEGWSNEAKIILESVSASTMAYRIDRTRLWTAIAVLLFLGGALITLGVMALDSKIQKAVDTAFNTKLDTVNH